MAYGPDLRRFPFVTNRPWRLPPAPQGMKMPLSRLVKELVYNWCPEPDDQSETGDLQAPQTVAPF